MIKKIKIYLVFFCFSIASICCTTIQEKEVHVVYKKDKAIAIELSNQLEGKLIEIKLKNRSQAILGEFNSGLEKINFRPIIPFQHQHIYEVFVDGKYFANFQVQSKILKEHPELLAVYPTKDTLPDNLLKIYLEFSQPMRPIGNVLDYITVIDKTVNSKVDLFLELQNPLWNHDFTILTLWLDPGRIKTGLIPNEELGNPLVGRHNYDLIINGNWRSAQNVGLLKPYRKSFFVIESDKQYPQLSKWNFSIPEYNSKEALIIDFKESLDAILVRETVQLLLNDTFINCEINTILNESGIQLIPEAPWEKGVYTLRVYSILEDVAGNNLNRLFDRDLLNPEISKDTEFKERIFNIH